MNFDVKERHKYELKRERMLKKREDEIFLFSSCKGWGFPKG